MFERNKIDNVRKRPRAGGITFADGTAAKGKLTPPSARRFPTC